MMAATMLYDDEKFHWNKEASPIASLEEQLGADNLADVAKSAEMLMSPGVSIDILEHPPFSLLSIKTLCALRDDAYRRGLYNDKLTANYREDVLLICNVELNRLRQISHLYASKLHLSMFRKLVLLTLYAPFNVIRTIIANAYESNITTNSNLKIQLSIIKQALLTCGDVLAYIVDNSGLTLSTTIFRDILVGFGNLRTSEAKQFESMNAIISLMSHSMRMHWKDNINRPLTLLLCIKHVVNPLIERGYTTSAVGSFICAVKQERRNGLDLSWPDQFYSTSTNLLALLSESMAFEVRSQEHDILFSMIDENVRNLETLLRVLVEVDALAKVFVNCTGLTWFTRLRIYPFLKRQFSGMETEKSPQQLEYEAIAKKIQRGTNKSSIMAHEQMILLCATASDINFELSSQGDSIVKTKIIGGETTKEHYALEEGKWVAALARQLWLLTKNELKQLMSMEISTVWHLFLPWRRKEETDKNHPRKSKQQEAHLHFLHLCLQISSGWLMKEDMSIIVSSTKTRQEEATVQICRAACDTVLNVVDDKDKGGVGCVPYVSMLISFVAVEDENYYAPCIDIVKMTVLDCVQKVARTVEKDELINAIQRINCQYEAPKNICVAALDVLRNAEK